MGAAATSATDPEAITPEQVDQLFREWSDRGAVIAEQLS